MPQEIVKFDLNNAISLENSRVAKEELQDEDFLDNKVSVSETIITGAINIRNTELSEYMWNDKIRKFETLSIDYIQAHLQSTEVNDILSENVKTEYGNCPDDIQIKFDNELLFCDHCHEVYQDYCTKCRVLVHILNERSFLNTYNRLRELPKYMLEPRESIGHLGIFSLKVIPEDVRLGPFTGLDSTGLSLKIKAGRFVVSDDKLDHLNWMQYINPARNIYEQNLSPFRYEDELYYCSTRRIHEGEELLVYFGEEYEDNLLKNVEMDFFPTVKNDVENVFACIFCCLGFRSKEYLAKHKSVCHNETHKIFSVEELTQCPFCKIYLEAKEYFKHHKDYCCGTNNGYCVLPTSEVYEVQLQRRSSLRSMVKIWKRGIYKCTQCKFQTMYNADFRHHTNEHYKVKMYKCGICHRRYKTKESLKAHVGKFHAVNEGRDVQKSSTCDYFKANIKNIIHRRDVEKRCQSSKYKFKTQKKCLLKSQIKLKHLYGGKYKCANCEFKTYYKIYLERHMKINHLVESNYNCAECKLETNCKSHIKIHMNATNLKENDYKCAECEFLTIYKTSLDTNIKAKDTKKKDYKCIECEYKAGRKSSLVRHIKRKHRKQEDYKCEECEFKTNCKSYLKVHKNAKHLEEKAYKCTQCVYKTNRKSDLVTHIKAKHLEQSNYKCAECEYKTNIKSYLQRHIRGKHLNGKDYKYTECEHKTHNESYLQAYIKAKLEEKNYKCMECEYKTYYRRDLERHIKTKHLKQSDYKCAECEFKTNYEPYLKRHMQRKHLKDNDYKCAECEFKTSEKSYLKVHVEVKHLNEKHYKCTECEFETNYISSLKGHVKTKHLKEKDYKCTECEYKTNYKSYLQRHIKAIHLKEKNYKCMECEYKTNYKANFKNHVNLKHLKQNNSECEF